VTEWGRRRVRRRSQSLVPPGEVVGYAVCAQSSGFGAFFVPYFFVSTALTWSVLLFLVPHLTGIDGPGNPVFWVGWQAAAIVAAWAVACLFNRYYILAVTDRSICVLDCGHFLSGMPHRIAEVLPRQFLGRAPGSWSRISVAGAPLLVPMIWRAELSAANCELLTSDTSQPVPTAAPPGAPMSP
jgi:hypothetical protein